MKQTTELIAVYSNVGHPQFPEDTWDKESKINNVDELLQVMKDIHRQDAHHFNDYPMNGGCASNGFQFYIEKSIEFEGEIYIGKREKTDHPEYFKEAVEMYLTFRKRMLCLLPFLRQKKREKDAEIKKRHTYLKLKEEFES